MLTRLGVTTRKFKNFILDIKLEIIRNIFKRHFSISPKLYFEIFVLIKLKYPRISIGRIKKDTKMFHHVNNFFIKRRKTW